MSDQSRWQSGDKHLLIEVPDHHPKGSLQGADDKETPVTAMTTFLRMGTFDPKAPGADLVNLADDGFVDDKRDRGANESVGNHGSSGGPGHELTGGQREKLSTRVAKLGGWQDHSDGNRVSTTRGDKVEVVRGNYKLLVLGRQDDPKKGAGWDVSGGHIQDGGLTPGGIHEIKWVQTWDGTWKVVEETEKGDVDTTFHGNVVERFYGATNDTFVGSEDEKRPQRDPNTKAVTQVASPNPAITETTFAASITTQTGSEKKPVPTITEKTWATDITSETGSSGKKISKIVEKTYASSVKTENYGGTFEEQYGSVTESVTKIDSKEWAHTKTEMGSYAALATMTSAATITELTHVGAMATVVTTGLLVDVELSALRVEVKAGAVFLEIEAGLVYTELGLHLAKLEFSFGFNIEYDKSKYEAAINSTSVGAKKNYIAAIWKALTPKGDLGLTPVDP